MQEEGGAPTLFIAGAVVLLFSFMLLRKLFCQRSAWPTAPCSLSLSLFVCLLLLSLPATTLIAVWPQR